MNLGQKHILANALQVCGPAVVFCSQFKIYACITVVVTNLKKKQQLTSNVSAMKLAVIIHFATVNM